MANGIDLSQDRNHTVAEVSTMATAIHEPRIGVRTLRNKLSSTLRRVRNGHERILVRDTNGKGVAALVSVEDLDTIRKIEDRIDNEAADKALEQMKATGEKTIPYEQIRRELGL